MSQSSNSWRRLVIFRPGQFGDTLVAFPVIEGLGRLFPAIPIIYCTNRLKAGNYVLGEDVARLSPFIDGVATYAVEDSVAAKWADLKKQLAPSREDLLVYLPYATATRFQISRDWLCFKSLGFRQLCGFRYVWRWAGQWPKLPVLPREAERLLNVVQDSGIPVQAPARCAVNQDDPWAEERWRQWGLSGRPVLALCPGSKMQAKRWPREGYVQVGREWHRQTGAALVIVGGPEEAELARSIVKEWPGYGFSACGATLSQTAAVLARARAYCGNDTGSMHLAALMGVPCVALFSLREPARLWFPFGDQHLVLQKEVPCAHCQVETCLTDPPLCLARITGPEVLAALEQVWPRRAA